MRRSFLVLAVTTLLAGALFSSAAPSKASKLGDGAFAAAPAALSAKTAQPGALSADTYAVGGGQANAGNQNFSLSAHIGPNGDFGQFHVKETSPEVSYVVDVFCVNIHGGNRGVIKGTVKKVSPVPNAQGVTVGETIILGVEDAGSPSDPVPMDDFFTPHTDSFPGNCKNIVYVANVNNVTQGNIRVKQ